MEKSWHCARDSFIFSSENLHHEFKRREVQRYVDIFVNSFSRVLRMNEIFPSTFGESLFWWYHQVLKINWFCFDDSIKIPGDRILKTSSEEINSREFVLALRVNKNIEFRKTKLPDLFKVRLKCLRNSRSKSTRLVRFIPWQQKSLNFASFPQFSL